MHHAIDVAAGGREHANVYFLVFVTPHRGEGEGLEHAQQLGLQAQVKVADFVDEQGPAVRLLEAADPAIGCAGEGAADVPEELAFDQSGRYRGTIDSHKWAFFSRAVVMQRLGNQLFSGAGFAQNQHRAVNLGSALDLGKDIFHLLGLADDLVQSKLLIEPPTQAIELFVLLHSFQSAANEQDQFIGVDRFGDVVISAGLHRLDCAFRGFFPGKYNELRIGLALLPELEQLDAADIAHVQIGENDVDIFVDVAQRFIGVFRAIDGEAFLLQQLHHDAAFGFVIFYNKHPS